MEKPPEVGKPAQLGGKPAGEVETKQAEREKAAVRVKSKLSSGFKLLVPRINTFRMPHLHKWKHFLFIKPFFVGIIIKRFQYEEGEK
ncbi:hypothetical protein ACE4RR_20300 [Alteribacillus sp. HJP-4]